MGTIRIQLSLELPGLSDRNIVISLNDNHQVDISTNLPDMVSINAAVDAYDTDFLAFMEKNIQRLRQQGCVRTTANYVSAFNMLRKYYQQPTLPMNQVNEAFIGSFECYLKQRGVTLNTSSFYMRILRAVYNRAVQQGIASDSHPFARVYTSVGKTEKRAVDAEAIRRIRELPCARKNELLARDLFLFSFYTRGMAFVDMAFLRKDDLRDGYLHYHRHKTGQQLVVKWEEQMQQIIARHPTDPSSPYLLPIIKQHGPRDWQQYRYRQGMANEELRLIGQRVGICSRLTMYVARHSWATIAKSLNTPVNVISEAMGHTNENTTHIYLKSINAGRIDQVNSAIIALIATR